MSSLIETKLFSIANDSAKSINFLPLPFFWKGGSTANRCMYKFLESLVSSQKYREASVIVDAAFNVNSELFSDIKKEIYLKLAEQETSLMAKGIYKFNPDS